MRSKYLFMSILSIAVFAMFLVLRAAGLPPQTTLTPKNSLPDQAKPVERIEVEVEARTLISATTERVTNRSRLPQDGPVYLERYCSQCHMPQWLEEITQSRTDWEKSLAKMETFGVSLNETTKIVLLDYLAADQP